LECSFLLCLLKLLGTGCADDKKKIGPCPASLRLRGMDDGPGQGCIDWHCLAVVMKSFSKTQEKQRANTCTRPAMERSADRLLLHSMSLRCTSCLPAFIIDTGQSAASMALY
jgi:hypothetical protein